MLIPGACANPRPASANGWRGRKVARAGDDRSAHQSLHASTRRSGGAMRDEGARGARNPRSTMRARNSIASASPAIARRASSTATCLRWPSQDTGRCPAWTISTAESRGLRWLAAWPRRSMFLTVSSDTRSRNATSNCCSVSRGSAGVPGAKQSVTLERTRRPARCTWSTSSGRGSPRRYGQLLPHGSGAFV